MSTGSQRCLPAEVAPRSSAEACTRGAECRGCAVCLSCCAGGAAELPGRPDGVRVRAGGGDHRAAGAGRCRRAARRWLPRCCLKARPRLRPPWAPRRSGSTGSESVMMRYSSVECACVERVNPSVVRARAKLHDVLLDGPSEACVQIWVANIGCLLSGRSVLVCVEAALPAWSRSTERWELFISAQTLGVLLSCQ